MERMGCEWRRNFPRVVRLVQEFVGKGGMQPAVDPVDRAVREKDEGHDGQN